MVRKKVEAAPSDEQVHHLFARNEPPDIEHVPFIHELYAAGLAAAVAWDKSGSPTHYRLSPAGQALIYQVMERNANRRSDCTRRQGDSTPR